jgi:hypothetical protein
MNPLRLFGWGQSTFSGKAAPTKSCSGKSSLTPALETDKWHSNSVHDAQAIIFLLFNLRNWRNFFSKFALNNSPQFIGGMLIHGSCI